MTEDIHDIFRQELFEDDKKIKSEFLKHFESDIVDFINAMAEAYNAWRRYDGTIGNNKRRAYVSAFLFNAINNLVASMKLFITGYAIPSGNLVRQTIESLCSAILCSNETLDYYQKIDRNEFSPQKFINIVLKHASKLKINKEAMSAIKKDYEFYHQLSHSSLLAIAHNISLSQLGTLFVGPSFDEEKMNGYKNEVIKS